jgi:hypothetical protein
MMTAKKEKEEREKLGIPVRGTSPGGEELNPKTKEHAQRSRALNYMFSESAHDFCKTRAARVEATSPETPLRGPEPRMTRTPNILAHR